MTSNNLNTLHQHLTDERATDVGARSSKTTDDELDFAIDQVARADAALVEGNVPAAVQIMARLAYVAGDSWPHSALGAEVLRCSQAVERASRRR